MFSAKSRELRYLLLISEYFGVQHPVEPYPDLTGVFKEIYAPVINAMEENRDLTQIDMRHYIIVLS